MKCASTLKDTQYPPHCAKVLSPLLILCKGNKINLECALTLSYRKSSPPEQHSFLVSQLYIHTPFEHTRSQHLTLLKGPHRNICIVETRKKLPVVVAGTKATPAWSPWKPISRTQLYVNLSCTSPRTAPAHCINIARIPLASWYILAED